MANPWGYGNQSDYLGVGNQYLAYQPPQQQGQQQSGGMPQINPMQFINQGGQGGGLFGAGATPTASAQASGTVGAHAAPYAGGGASGGGAGGGSMWSGLASNPYAWIAALAVGNELNANHEGRRDSDAFKGESAITGRALYKDTDHLAEQGNKILPGWGDDITIAGRLSSPLDVFRKDTWSDVWDSAKKGGTLGGLLRKVF